LKEYDLAMENFQKSLDWSQQKEVFLKWLLLLINLFKGIRIRMSCYWTNRGDIYWIELFWWVFRGFICNKRNLNDIFSLDWILEMLWIEQKNQKHQTSARLFNVYNQNHGEKHKGGKSWKHFKHS
jgi:hypothetical protein